MLSHIDDYLRRMEVPLNVIEMMESTPSNDISFLPSEVARSMQIPPSIKEWLIPYCGAMTLQEQSDRDKLYITKMLRPEYLDTQSSQYLRYLDNKDQQIDFCNMTKLYREHVKLALEAPLARLDATQMKR